MKTTVGEVLTRIASTRAVPTGPLCEMCAAGIGDEHQHVVDVQVRSLMCVCRPCYLLFAPVDADLRYKAVPDRYLEFPDFDLGPGRWESLEIPVGLAFFFRNSLLDKYIVFYPGPAGATESELPIDSFETVLAENPGLSQMRADVEALIVSVPASGQSPRCFVVPIDACYELVGRLRTVWRGFDGGQDAARAVDEFFGRVEARSRSA
ncbi:hypothetical protein AC1659_02890 [Rhodococcus erythropolis]|jgi:hypothetical protein|uniref:DUF5947 family protein n=1 Tax=Rhodococcus erythropolis TaxID=1833 RepID=UPI00159506A9|nr:DUF5947 family protein [Rhodococcus erythropolis]MBS2988202.1 hypothetical protein [Rhodococcus erythropolis]